MTMRQRILGTFILLFSVLFTGCATTYVDPNLTTRDVEKIAILEPHQLRGDEFYITQINGIHRGIGLFNRFELAPGRISITAVPNPSYYEGGPLTNYFTAEAGKKYYFMPGVNWEARQWSFSIVENFEWAKQHNAESENEPTATESSANKSVVTVPSVTEPVTTESSANEPEAPAVREPLRIDLSGTYSSEITARSHYSFRNRYRKLEVSIVQNGNGELQFTTSPNIALSGKVQGNKVVFTTGRGTSGCYCAFVDGEWEVHSDGQHLVGSWTRAAGGKGTWNLTRIR